MLTTLLCTELALLLGITEELLLEIGFFTGGVVAVVEGLLEDDCAVLLLALLLGKKFSDVGRVLGTARMLSGEQAETRSVAETKRTTSGREEVMRVGRRELLKYSVHYAESEGYPFFKANIFCVFIFLTIPLLLQ